jgi:hypothetical protein
LQCGQNSFEPEQGGSPLTAKWLRSLSLEKYETTFRDNSVE